MAGLAPGLRNVGPSLTKSVTPPPGNVSQTSPEGGTSLTIAPLNVPACAATANPHEAATAAQMEMVRIVHPQQRTTRCDRRPWAMNVDFAIAGAKQAMRKT